jgi:ABC-type dipeptide/oligopeptide/nickel transport system permease subunit
MSRLRPRVPRFAKTPAGAVGLTLLVAMLAIALFGPLVSPHSITATVGPPGQAPSSAAPLGTDFLGRDVLSRLLHGGLSVVLLGGAATALAYALGVTVGLTAGFSRSIVDPILMRGVDVLLAFPALLILLLLVSGLGTHVWVLLLGVALVQLPGIARVMRTTTLEASTRGYVEAALARGERTSAVLRREILPNIAPVLLADFGIRFGVSIVFIASMNFLSLGLTPPRADWGLMMSENRDYIALNLWSVLAPAIMLALLTISVNLTADAYVRSLGRSVTIGWRRRRGLGQIPAGTESAAIEGSGEPA